MQHWTVAEAVLLFVRDGKRFVWLRSEIGAFGPLIMMLTAAQFTEPMIICGNLHAVQGLSIGQY